MALSPPDRTLAALALLATGAGCFTHDLTAITFEHQSVDHLGDEDIPQDDRVGFSVHALYYEGWGGYVSARGSLASPQLEDRDPGPSHTLVRMDSDPSVLNAGAVIPLWSSAPDPDADEDNPPRWIVQGLVGLGWARRTKFAKYRKPAGDTYWVEHEDPDDELSMNLGLIGVLGHLAATVSYDTDQQAVAFGIGFAF